MISDERKTVLDGLDLLAGHHGLAHHVPGHPVPLPRLVQPAVVRSAHQLLSGGGEGTADIDMITQRALTEQGDKRV